MVSFDHAVLVEMVQPSINGSKSRWTPSRDTSGPELWPPRLQIFVELIDEDDTILFNRFNRPSLALQGWLI